MRLAREQIFADGVERESGVQQDGVGILCGLQCRPVVAKTRAASRTAFLVGIASPIGARNPETDLAIESVRSDLDVAEGDLL